MTMMHHGGYAGVDEAPCHGRCAGAAQRHPRLSREQGQLVDEVFSLFDISHDYEFQYDSVASLVSRIKEIYSSSDPVMDVNVPSNDGDTLLRLCVSSFHLEEEDPEAQYDLVRFLLDKGADPNLEDSLGETALDWLVDQSTSGEDSLTEQQLDMVRLLVDYGSRVYHLDSQGHRYGARVVNVLDGGSNKTRGTNQRRQSRNCRSRSWDDHVPDQSLFWMTTVSDMPHLHHSNGSGSGGTENGTKYEHAHERPTQTATWRVLETSLGREIQIVDDASRAVDRLVVLRSRY